MKIGPVEKILIALSVLVVLGSFAFAIAARPQSDAVAMLKTLGMTCGSCAGTIEKTLLAHPGVAEASVNVETAQVTVVYDSRATRPETLAEAVSAAGYRSAVARTLTLAQHRQQAPRPSSQASKGGCGSACCD